MVRRASRLYCANRCRRYPRRCIYDQIETLANLGRARLRGVGREEAELGGSDGRLGAVGNVELGDDVLEMGLDRAEAEGKLGRDLLIGVTAGHQPQDLAL